MLLYGKEVPYTESVMQQVRGRINYEKNMDPDFSELALFENTYVLKVSVEQSGGRGFWFFLILPQPENANDIESWAKDACERSLAPGDYYRVHEISDDDLMHFQKSIPILSFDPRVHDDSGQEEWVWLVPPMCLRN